jgi:hypothetical protein
MFVNIQLDFVYEINLVASEYNNSGQHTQEINGFTTGGKDDDGEFTSPVDTL